MISISAKDGALTIDLGGSPLASRQASQMAFWGFVRRQGSDCLSYVGYDIPGVLAKISPYLRQQKVKFAIDAGAVTILRDIKNAASEIETAREQGKRFKDADLSVNRFGEFVGFLRTKLKRKLIPHQIKAALHLLHTTNGANFSVPGSGKTTVVLAVYEWLRKRGEVDALFVVGPPSCFGPWRMEYKEVLGVEPRSAVLAGGDIEARRSQYIVDRLEACDLYLTSFQTLQRDWEHVRVLFSQLGIRFFFVVDEAHYIKQLGGAWATAVLNLSKHASRRCILTGTPFPNRFGDVFNLFDVLWPQGSAIPAPQRHLIERHTDKREFERAAKILDETIGPLFYRVRKVDLGLAKQVFHPAVIVRMNTYERQVYDAVIGRIRNLSLLDSHKTVDLIMRLRRGRMIRLRQCLSNAGLLGSAVPEYEEELLTGDMSLSEVIRRYKQLEKPAKLAALVGLVDDLRKKTEKVVIWSNFVRTLEMIQETLQSTGYGVRLIYGATPIEEEAIEDGLSRGEIIRDFCDPKSGVDILVANPAACAESVSLHKTCSNAIYYDMSYNCGQYLQSLDRIHRVGGSESKEAHYHFLQYEDSIDEDILRKVRNKAKRMSNVIDKNYAVYSLDMFSTDDELAAYERLFGRRRKKL